MKRIFIFDRAVALIVLFSCFLSAVAVDGYKVSGRVVDKISRTPVVYALVSVVGSNESKAFTDTLGMFVIENVTPGVKRFSVECMGYKSLVSSEYIVSANLPFIELEIEEDPSTISDITVTASSLRRDRESPVSMQIIGIGDIEKSPGGNRDISRIVRNSPGVAFSPVGYRNDLIVRGGGPSENRFFMDGIEIPNINHFATQGASGGPVSILNADLVREVQFYTGVFPVDKAGALSSAMDIRLREGNPDGYGFKATLGASEVSLSGDGHIGKNTTYLFSLRQSYLQLLFKMLGLPFLPNFIDGQFKVKTRIDKSNEVEFLGLAGIDDMKLNTDEKGEDAEYLLSYLPRITQQTFTVGTVYRHYSKHGVQTLSLGYNYLGNQNKKYFNNDKSDPANLTLDLSSREQKLTLRAENKSYGERWRLTEGVEMFYSDYYNRTRQKIYNTDPSLNDYRTNLGLFGAALYASAQYTSSDERFRATFGLRTDGSGYSSSLSRFWENISPNLSLSYMFVPEWSVNAGAGIYHQLPALTSLGYKDNSGRYVNKGLRYQQVANVSLGVSWNHDERIMATAEAFFKSYSRMPLSLTDSIPLACKGNDYGVVGNEALAPDASGLAYGVEASLRWQIPDRLTLISTFTFYRSKFRNGPDEKYFSSAWDNRFIGNICGTYDFPHNWSLGARLSVIGGAPYTPYDVDKSSLVEAWDAQGRPCYDYSRYNEGRLDAFCQLDLRVDKNYYFKGWSLGLYVDIQNVTASVLHQPDVLMSTGVIENPSAPLSEQRYKMKYISQDSGTLLPSIGVTVQF